MIGLVRYLGEVNAVATAALVAESDAYAAWLSATDDHGEGSAVEVNACDTYDAAKSYRARCVAERDALVMVCESMSGAMSSMVRIMGERELAPRGHGATYRPTVDDDVIGGICQVGGDYAWTSEWTPTPTSKHVAGVVSYVTVVGEYVTGHVSDAGVLVTDTVTREGLMPMVWRPRVAVAKRVVRDTLTAVGEGSDDPMFGLVSVLPYGVSHGRGAWEWSSEDDVNAGPDRTLLEQCAFCAKCGAMWTTRRKLVRGHVWEDMTSAQRQSWLAKVDHDSHGVLVGRWDIDYLPPRARRNAKRCDHHRVGVGVGVTDTGAFGTITTTIVHVRPYWQVLVKRAPRKGQRSLYALRRMPATPTDGLIGPRLLLKRGDIAVSEPMLITGRLRTELVNVGHHVKTMVMETPAVMTDGKWSDVTPYAQGCYVTTNAVVVGDQGYKVSDGVAVLTFAKVKVGKGSATTRRHARDSAKVDQRVGKAPVNKGKKGKPRKVAAVCSQRVVGT
jgi:hypothetical protein